MKNQPITIISLKLKAKSKKLLMLPSAFCFQLSAFGLLLMLSAISTKAQTLVTAPMTGTPAAGNYYSNNSITLSPGFSFTAGAGQSLYLYISAPDCVPLTDNLSPSQNYILTSVPRIPGYVPPAVNTNPANYTTCDVMQTVQYLDGLGRPLQTIQIKGSAKGNDLVQPIAYDQFGREAVKYLPYAHTSSAGDGSYKPNALTVDQPSFYTSPPSGVAMVSSPFAATGFEPSPLNRPVEQGAPGSPWQLGGGHTVGTGYSTNAANEVTLWTVTANGASGTSYAPNTLYKTTVTDENGNGTTEYKDLQGRVVCKKDAAGAATNYVYDDFGNLAYVVPPGAAVSSFNESDAIFLNFIYAYHYDGRNRVIEKKLPGKDWEYLVYNTLDQVIFSQDGVQRSQSPEQWTFTKYDALGRVVLTGVYEDDEHNGQANTNYRVNFQNIADYYGAVGQLWETRDNSNGVTGYSNVAIAQGSIPVYLTINYYDDYTAPGMPYDYHTGYSSMTKGLLTATKTNVLGTNDMLWTVHYYDDKGREVKTYQQHYLSGAQSVNNYDETATAYNFDNSVAAVTRQHHTNAAGGGVALAIAETYSYDHMGRKTQTDESINGATATTIAKLTYNETGQLLNKQLGNGLQTVNYAYNERGWLRTANSSSSLFNMELQYNAGGSPQYNGNISVMNYSGQNSGSKSFSYTYDPLNRLTNASSTSGILDEAIGYDAMGNISSLTRGSYGSLGYSYNGNQLTGVTGYSPRSYGYDANGNATSDGISKSITYNLLNLPATVGSGTATYTYDAAGKKLRNTGTDGSWDYISGIVYHNNAIAFVGHEEGRAVPNGGNYTYQYNLKDHLGNSRVSFYSSNGNPAVLQEDEYYSFGLRRSLYDNSNNNRYLYNGKEIQTDLANQYDYGARFYDPVIGRWTSVDELAEHPNQIDKTPYAYVWNNPVSKNDPDGKCPSCIIAAALEAAGTEEVATGGVGTPAALATIGAGLVVAGVDALWTWGSNVYHQHQAAQGIQTHIVKNIINEPNEEAKGANKDNTYDRVKARKGTREKVREQQPKDETGKMIDPNTGQTLDENSMDLGHVYGQEWRTRRKEHEEKGLTRKEVIEAENDPKIYQYEDRKSNRSRVHEKKDDNK